MILPKVLDLEGIMWSLRLSMSAFDVVYMLLWMPEP